MVRGDKRRRVLTAVLLFLLCGAFALAAFGQLKRMRGETPAGVWVHDARGLNVSYMQAKVVYKARSISYGFCSVPFAATASDMGKSVAVQAAAANSYWGEHAKLELAGGEWYSQDAVMEDENWAVIPYALALELYAGVAVPPRGHNKAGG